MITGAGFTLFKHLKFRKLPLAQVEHDLIRVKEAGGKPKAVFLGDGNAFYFPTEELEEILKLVVKDFRKGHRYAMDYRTASCWSYWKSWNNYIVWEWNHCIWALRVVWKRCLLL